MEGCNEEAYQHLLGRWALATQVADMLADDMRAIAEEVRRVSPRLADTILDAPSLEAYQTLREVGV